MTRSSQSSRPDQADTETALRQQLVASLHDERVHASFEKIFEGVPVNLRNAKPAGQPFTLWRLLEHLRLCVMDIRDSCRVPGYVEPPFPEGYWPSGDAPTSDAAWEQSLAGFRSSMAELEALILDPSIDLFASIPGGSGRTVLRQMLACLDHNAYHLGQATLVRRLLGIWSE